MHSQNRCGFALIPAGLAESGEDELLLKFPDGVGIGNACPVDLKDHGIKLGAGRIRVFFGHVFNRGQLPSRARNHTAFYAGLSESLIGSHGTNFLARNFFLGTTPVFEFATFFPSAGLLKFICPTTDLLCKIRIWLGDYLHL